jgi:hypothetical protein
LVSHGLRKRTAWAAVAYVLLLWRWKCWSRGGCGRVFTVLPSFVHPCKRYVLAQIVPVLEARFLEGLSLDAVDRRIQALRPAASTQRDWMWGFAQAAGLWLDALSGWFARWNPATVLPRAAEAGAARGLVAQAVHALDWMRGERACMPVEPARWLQELWLWGSVRLSERLFSTRSRAGPFHRPRLTSRPPPARGSPEDGR